MVDPLSKSELFYPVRSQRWTVNRGETHGTLQAGSDGCGVSHSEFAVQGGYLLLLKLLFCRNLIGGCETKKTSYSKIQKKYVISDGYPNHHVIGMSCAKKGQRGQNEQKFGPSKKMTISGPSKKMTHSHMRVWEVSTTIPPNFWPIPCHMFLTATPNNKKEQLKTLEWGSIQ